MCSCPLLSPLDTFIPDSRYFLRRRRRRRRNLFHDRYCVLAFMALMGGFEGKGEGWLSSHNTVLENPLSETCESCYDSNPPGLLGEERSVLCRTHLTVFYEKDKAANLRRAGSEGCRFITCRQRGLFTAESLLKSTLPLVTCINNFNSWERLVGRLSICFAREKCNLSSKGSWRL